MQIIRLCQIQLQMCVSKIVVFPTGVSGASESDLLYLDKIKVICCIHVMFMYNVIDVLHSCNSTYCSGP